jgi:hypothetical protein
VYVSTLTTTPSRHNCNWRNESVSSVKDITLEIAPARTASDAAGTVTLAIGVVGYTAGETPYRLLLEAVPPPPVGDAVGSAASGGSSRTSAVVVDLDPGQRQCGTCMAVIAVERFAMHEAYCARNNWRCPTCQQVRCCLLWHG